MLCNNCPRNCNVDRDNKLGFCKLNNTVQVALACVHHGEEPVISGSKGSGTIFFSGCNLKCVYCQNYQLSENNYGKEIGVERLVEIIKELEQKGVHNINLVTPTPYVQQIISALKIYKPKIPVVYNCSGYESVEALKQLNPYIDVYLTDLKYHDNSLAMKYSLCPDYFEKATLAINQMFINQPKNIFKNGTMQKGVIVRHMVLPTHSNDSMKILDWITKNHSGATVSIMGQFTPIHKCEQFPEINRKLKPVEYKRVLSHASSLSIEGFYQDLTSATTTEIPTFDLSGV